MKRLLSILIIFVCLLATGCAAMLPNSSPSSNQTSPPSESASTAVTPERMAILSHYTYFELYAALELSEHVVTMAKQPEGESSLGCRLDVAKVQLWLPSLLALVETAAENERQTYQESQQKYQRSRGFDRCAPKCSCAALTKVLNGVPLKTLKSQDARTMHRDYLRKLGAKAMRMNAEEQRACAERQSWFCGSELRDFLQNEPLSPFVKTERNQKN